MYDNAEFVIKDGVLVECVGPGGDVIIPDDITRIRPDGVTEIGGVAICV